MHSASPAIPPFPGAHQIFSTSGLCLSLQTSACSRPPPPITRIFIRTHPLTLLSNDSRPSKSCQPDAFFTGVFISSKTPRYHVNQLTRTVLAYSYRESFRSLHSKKTNSCFQLSGKGFAMLIPLRHENMEGSRWPVVTFALIALNVIVFLGTHWQMEAQSPDRAEVRMHIILLAGMHPELKMSEDVQQFISDVQRKIPEKYWKQIADPNRKAEDAWDTGIRRVTDPQELQAEMDSLVERFAELEKSSILDNYGFVPAHAGPITYLTSMFLHTGWLHLIGNMWFLWLAGFVLEDRWGRVIYPVFYLLAGVAASLFHALFYPGSIVPALGASGAVAALMGGFLVRFPKLKIEMLWFMLIFRIRFKAYAYWLLPLWLLTEVFYGSLFGQSSGVAHWAHVGGFLFGGLAALVIQRTGLEQQANAVIEEKIGWTADPAIVKGTEFMEQGKLDEAIAVLQRHVAANPDAVDAYSLLRQVRSRKNDLPPHPQAIVQLCQLHLQGR